MNASPWTEYYNNTLGSKPNDTVIFADRQFREKADKRVLDIGSGTGCDSLYLLERGFTVTALDQEKSALEILKKKTPKKFARNLSLEHARIQDFDIGVNRWDLINASFCLPFCCKTDFSVVWKNIHAGLKTGGLFSGHLFGVNDDWSGIPGMSFVTNEEVDDLLNGYIPEYYREIDEDGRIADGSVKHWHLFNLVLRKE